MVKNGIKYIFSNSDFYQEVIALNYSNQGDKANQSYHRMKTTENIS